MSEKQYLILLVDDDTEILQVNKLFLERENFIVKTATSATEGLIILKENPPDCIVLDMMMPEVNGLSACKKYRTITKAPIIFLTGVTSENDKISAFTLGADDYLIKPYSLKELLVRIQANIRRSQSYSMPPSFQFGKYALDLSVHKLFCEQEEISLTNREYELLFLLMSNPNKLVTFEDIGISLFGIYNDQDRRSVMVHISRLRKRLELYPELYNMIQTVWSKGYCFTI